MGASRRLTSHQVRPPANRVSNKAANRTRRWIERIGAKASSVGSETTKSQPAAPIRAAEVNTSTPWGLVPTTVLVSPPRK